MAREEHVSGVETINRVDSSSGHGQVLRLRMSPHNVPEVSRVEMLADCPIDHPFFVKDKGKCSLSSSSVFTKYLGFFQAHCHNAELNCGKITTLVYRKNI